MEAFVSRVLPHLCTKVPAERTIANITYSIVNEVTNEEFHLVLSRDEEWDQLVADVELTRHEAKAVHERLKKHEKLTAVEIKEMCQQEKEVREKFLKILYSQVKKDVEVHIKQLYAFAEMTDKVHKICTIVNVVADSIVILSNILYIMGIGLAPFTAGLSSAVSEPALSMGILAIITAVVSTTIDHRCMACIEAEVNKLESTEKNLHRLWELLGDSKERISSLINNFKVARNIENYAYCNRLSMLGPRLGAHNVWGTMLVDTASTMSKGTYVIGGVSKGLAILLDGYSLLQVSKDLQDVGKSQSGQKLRQWAQELENMLVRLQQFYKNLK
ncbi:apolipoprotein L3-like [Sorex fumeus]|uniref:apolipoprotein L3-like n=1 Tax=Sorex fumeus TaxID=62283 RepID=UPI0024AE238A|nr:apolipoprotein L3-like [Sorex fumeus]